MKHKPDWIEKRQSLRKEAEGMLSGLSPAELTARPAEALLHELLVHKVELEMQIEELQRAHTLLEEERDRYLDIYDFAPVGYLAIDSECLISEINPTGATLLGINRIEAFKVPFAMYVAPRHRERWSTRFRNMMEHRKGEKPGFVLEMVRADNSTFRGYLDCRRRELADGSAILRLALIDVDRIASAEADLG